jgi:hypothetical protein
MKIYHAYNLVIYSELSIPELTPYSEASSTDWPRRSVDALATDVPFAVDADVVIRFGNVQREAGHYVDPTRDDPNYLFVREDGVGAFFIRQGCEIVIDPVAHFDAGYLRTLLLGPLFAILLRQRGLLVLHASAVKLGDCAVAFLGGSGWGKSTLVTAFHQRGNTVLTDDVMPLQMDGGLSLVLPSYPQFKLCPDAAASFGKEEELVPIFQGAGKLAYSITDGFQHTPLPLQHIYILGKGDRHAIVPVAPQLAFMELVQHTRAMISLTQAPFLAAHFQLCTQLVKTVPVSRFIRKPALEDLPRLMDMIEADVAQSVKPDLVGVP